MRKILIIALASIFLPLAAFASPCNGKNVLIINDAKIKFLVGHIDTGKSSVAPLAEGFALPGGQSVLSVVQSGKGSWGNAKGTIELMAPLFPGKTIKLHYSYTKILPFWCRIDDPVAEFDAPFRVAAHKDGTKTIFEISKFVANDDNNTPE